MLSILDGMARLLRKAKKMKRIGTVNRIEIIDWTKSCEGFGRAYVKWVKPKFDVKIAFQDNKRTIKIFLIDLLSQQEEGKRG